MLSKQKLGELKKIRTKAFIKYVKARKKAMNTRDKKIVTKINKLENKLEKLHIQAHKTIKPELRENMNHASKELRAVMTRIDRGTHGICKVHAVR